MSDCRQLAQVVAVDQETTVSPTSKRACGQCAGKGGGCQSLDWGRLLFPRLKRTYLVDNPLAAPVGAWVWVSTPRGSLWRSAFLAFGLPLFGLFLGIAIGQGSGTEKIVLLYGFMGLVVGAYLARLSQNWAVMNQPVIVALVDNTDQVIQGPY